jgi:hypothetical protein
MFTPLQKLVIGSIIFSVFISFLLFPCGRIFNQYENPAIKLVEMERVPRLKDRELIETKKAKYSDSEVYRYECENPNTGVFIYQTIILAIVLIKVSYWVNGLQDKKTEKD